MTTEQVYDEAKEVWLTWLENYDGDITTFTLREMFLLGYGAALKHNNMIEDD
jgi:hypothetical protein